MKGVNEKDFQFLEDGNKKDKLPWYKALLSVPFVIMGTLVLFLLGLFVVFNIFGWGTYGLFYYANLPTEIQTIGEYKIYKVDGSGRDMPNYYYYVLCHNDINNEECIRNPKIYGLTNINKGTYYIFNGSWIILTSDGIEIYEKDDLVNLTKEEQEVFNRISILPKYCEDGGDARVYTRENSTECWIRNAIIEL